MIDYFNIIIVLKVNQKEKKNRKYVYTERNNIKLDHQSRRQRPIHLVISAFCALFIFSLRT